MLHICNMGALPCATREAAMAFLLLTTTQGGGR